MQNCNCKLIDGKSCEHGYRLNTPNVRFLESLRGKTNRVY